MPKSSITIERVAELCARLINGESQNRISRSMRLGNSTAQRAARTLLKFGITLPEPASSALPAEVKSVAFSLFETSDLSNRRIAEQVGCGLESVNRLRRDFNARKVAAGATLPLCACGRYLHHQGLCSARGRRLPSALSDRTAAEREGTLLRLLRGDTFKSIAQWLEVPVKLVHAFCRALPLEDRERRKAARRLPAHRARAAAVSAKVRRPHATDPRADPTFALILRELPKGIDPAIAEDAAADAYLALIEGRCSAGKLPQAVKRAVSSNFERFANPWGDLSLDAARGPQGEDTWIDNLEDPRALAAFGDL